MKDLYIIGASGHGKVIADIAVVIRNIIEQVTYVGVPAEKKKSFCNTDNRGRVKKQ